MSQLLPSSNLAELVSRMGLWPKLLRRQQEEEIVSLVPISSDYLDNEREKALKDQPLDQYLLDRGWSESDLIFTSLVHKHYVCFPSILVLV